MTQRDLDDKIREMVSLLASKMKEEATSDSKIYSEFEIDMPGNCLTHVMLSIDPVAKHRPDSEGSYYLTLTGYKLPCPYKAVNVLMRETLDEILKFLDTKDIIWQITRLIPKLHSELDDM